MKNQVDGEKLRLMVFESAKELGQKVDEHLLDMYKLNKKKYTFIVPIKENFFDDGHLKVEITETVRGKDMFFITDMMNSLTTIRREWLLHTELLIKTVYV